MTESALGSLQPARRELARRTSGSVDVALYWDARDGSITVEVWQREVGVELAFPVEPEHALDAFYHPFAHVPGAAPETTLGLAS